MRRKKNFINIIYVNTVGKNNNQIANHLYEY